MIILGFCDSMKAIMNCTCLTERACWRDVDQRQVTLWAALAHMPHLASLSLGAFSTVYLCVPPETAAKLAPSLTRYTESTTM